MDKNFYYRLCNNEDRRLLKNQCKEVYDQGDFCRVTCECGVSIDLPDAYRCLYCGIWFCFECAEKHFGKTVEQHMNERRAAFLAKRRAKQPTANKMNTETKPALDPIMTKFRAILTPMCKDLGITLSADDTVFDMIVYLYMKGSMVPALEAQVKAIAAERDVKISELCSVDALLANRDALEACRDREHKISKLLDAAKQSAEGGQIHDALVKANQQVEALLADQRQKLKSLIAFEFENTKMSEAAEENRLQIASLTAELAHVDEHLAKFVCLPENVGRLDKLAHMIHLLVDQQSAPHS